MPFFRQSSIIAGVLVHSLLFTPLALSEEDVNLALHASVRLDGVFWTGGWHGGDVPPDRDRRAATLVDGKMFPRGTRWDQGTVWWDARKRGAERNHIEIHLARLSEIVAVLIQGDDNDAYHLEYMTDDGWRTAWRVPNHDASGWGLQSFPSPNDPTKRHFLRPAVITKALRIRGDALDGDGWYALSEIKLFGRQVGQVSLVTQ